MKKCERCESAQPLTSFYRHLRQPDGYQPWCKACVADHRRTGQKPVASPRLQRKRLTPYHNMAEVLNRIATATSLGDVRQEVDRARTKYRLEAA